MRAGLQVASLVMAAVPLVLLLAWPLAFWLDWAFLQTVVDYAAEPAIVCWGAAAVIFAFQYWNEENKITSMSLLTLILVGTSPLVVFVLGAIGIFSGTMD